jgi:hypothetical protein
MEIRALLALKGTISYPIGYSKGIIFLIGQTAYSKVVIKLAFF